MSVEALDLYRQQRDYQVEDGQFSEEFQIVGGDTFRGVWDLAHMQDNKDRGNVMQKKLNPRIMISTIPAGLEERTTQITRVSTLETFTYFFVDKTDEGIPILWLY